jgi:hypothetical protein
LASIIRAFDPTPWQQQRQQQQNQAALQRGRSANPNHQRNQQQQQPQPQHSPFQRKHHTPQNKHKKNYRRAWQKPSTRPETHLIPAFVI